MSDPELSPPVRATLRARYAALLPLAERAAWSGDQVLFCGIPKRVVATYVLAVHRRSDPVQAILRKRFGRCEVGPGAREWVRAEVAHLQRLSAGLGQ